MNASATDTFTVTLDRLAHGRTGDKGNRSNISVIAWHPALWDVLVEQVTEAAVAQQFAQRRPRQVTRYLLLDMPVTVPAHLAPHFGGPTA